MPRKAKPTPPFEPGDIVRHDAWPAGQTRIVLGCVHQPMPPQLDRGVHEFTTILDRPAYEEGEEEPGPDANEAERNINSYWMAAGLKKVGRLPHPDTAASRSMKYQLNFDMPGDPPCFKRGTFDKELLERDADYIRATGGWAFITEIPSEYHPALIAHYNK